MTLNTLNFDYKMVGSDAVWLILALYGVRVESANVKETGRANMASIWSKG